MITLHSLLCLTAGAGVCFFLWCAGYAVNVRREHRAEELLERLRALQVEKSSRDEAETLSREFGGKRECKAAECEYALEISFGVHDLLSRALTKRSDVDYVGLRPWRFTATVGVRDDRVGSIGFTEMVARGRGWLYRDGLLEGPMWSWLAASTDISRDGFDWRLKFEQETARRDPALVSKWQHSGLYVTQPAMDIHGGGEMLKAVLSPDAHDDRREAAFAVNLKCATAMKSCLWRCELAPQMWRRYVEQQEAQGYWVEKPDECAAALQ